MKRGELGINHALGVTPKPIYKVSHWFRKSEFLSVLANQIEVILGSFKELPNRNTVVEVSKELSLLQISKSGELIEIEIS